MLLQGTAGWVAAPTHHSKPRHATWLQVLFHGALVKVKIFSDIPTRAGGRTAVVLLTSCHRHVHVGRACAACMTGRFIAAPGCAVLPQLAIAGVWTSSVCCMMHVQGHADARRRHLTQALEVGPEHRAGHGLPARPRD